MTNLNPLDRADEEERSEMKFYKRGIFVASIAFISVLGAPASAQLLTSDFTGCSLEGADDRCEAWVTLYDDDEISPTAAESPADIAVAPDGSGIYTAARITVGSGWDGKARWVVLAHDNAGQEEWKSLWGEIGKHSFPTSIAVSPDGRLVFVSGTWRDDQSSVDGHLTTIAFDATDGSLVWKANYDGPANGTDNAREIAVSPDGKTLYIAGISAGASNHDLDYAAIAYDTSTGTERWVTRWDGIGKNQTDTPFAIDVSSDGSMVYLTGWSYGEGEYNNDYGTIAVATSGEQAGKIVWSARYDGVGVGAPDQVSALTIAPDNKTLFVTGMSNDVEDGPPFDVNYGFATVAYDAITGQQLWESRKQWEGTTFNSPNAIAIDPEGDHLVVSGQVNNRQLDFGTVTYDPRSGQELWADRYGFQDYDLELARDIAMDPQGDTVYVTGVSAKSPPGVPGVVLYAPNADQLTIAYDVATGAKKWLARFNPSITDFVSVQSMAISPDATKIYTVASINDQNWDDDGDDFQTGIVAYEIGAGIPIPTSPPKLEFSETSATYGQYSDPTTLSARLTDGDGQPITGAEVRFEFQGGVATALTDETGVASTNHTLTNKPGQYPVDVFYEGEDDSHGSAHVAGTYTIDTEDTVLSLTMDRGTRTLVARLLDADSGAGVEGREIDFYFNQQSLGTATTDGDGFAYLTDEQAANRSPKHLQAHFEGDDFYRPANSS